MKYLLPLILITSVLIVSGCTGQTVDPSAEPVSEADWINPPPELAGDDVDTTVETTVSNEPTTTVLTENRYWFDTLAEADDFKANANLNGTSYTTVECVQRLNSEGQNAWKCELS